MYSSSVLVLALAVFGASAQVISSGCGLNGGINGISGIGGINGFSGVNGIGGINGFSGVNGINGIGGFSGVNGINGIGGFSGIGASVASSPVIENVPVRLPSIIHQATVQDSCNCVKTIVRPQFRKEVFTVPSVQRFVQTTSTPVVETVPYVSGSSVDVPSAVSGIETGLVGGSVSGLGSGIVSGVNTGFGGLVSGVNSGLGGIVSGVNTGIVSGINGGLVSGVNGGFGGVTGVVSGINSGFGASC